MAWRISRDKQFNSAKKNNQIMHSLTFKIVYVPIWKFNPYKQSMDALLKSCFECFGNTQISTIQKIQKII